MEDPTHHITATVSYNLTSGQTARMDLGDTTTSPPTSSSIGSYVNVIALHTYSNSSAHTVQLQILNSSHTVIQTCTLTTSNTPSDVTLSSMSADSPEGGINWTAVGFALLGLVVLGQLALFAVIKQRR